MKEIKKIIHLSKNLIVDLIEFQSGVLNYPCGQKTINETKLNEIIEAIMQNNYTMTNTFKHGAKKLNKILALNDKKALKEYIKQLAFSWNAL